NYKAKPSKAAGDNKASDADKKKAAASKTEMNVGDTFRYHDGITVTVTSIDRFTKFSEYDSKPSAGETAFRINI
ncbi:hypothetical protein KBZ21_49515, partial [Streptomyces sp. A73]|nr:hypothetical protein [Streptomyces sp. A73]